jgi:ferrous iron transport protein B
VFGFVIFIAILLFMFQAIFSWSAYPMSLIEDLFVWIEGGLRTLYCLPGRLVSLLIDGVVAGLSGVMVFIPQIAILFALYLYWKIPAICRALRL